MRVNRGISRRPASFKANNTLAQAVVPQCTKRAMTKSLAHGDEANQPQEDSTAVLPDVPDDDFENVVLSERKNMLERLARKNPDEMALKDGVPRKIVITWIDKELREEMACKSIPFIIILLIIFVVMVDSHLAQKEVRGVEQSISNFLQNAPNFGFATGDKIVGHNAMKDIYTVSDLYSWVNLGFLPALHTASFKVSENIAPSVGHIKVQHKNFNHERPATGEFLTFNTIIGGVKFQQSTAKQSDCKLPDEFMTEIDAPCFGSVLYLTDPGASDSMALKIEDAEREEYFLLSKPLSSWLEKSKDLELGCKTRVANGETCQCTTCGDHPWIDPSTLRVEMAFISVNRELGLWSHVNVNFFLNRGGRIWQSINVESQWVDPYERGIQLAIEEVVWFLMNMWILAQEIRDIYIETQGAGGLRYLPEQLWRYFHDPWNLIDCMTIIISLFILVVWIVHIQRSSKLRHDFPIHYTTFDTGKQQADFFFAVEEVFALEFYVRVLFSVYAIVIMCRLFKGYSAQPRLALVTRTLETAGLDLIHFLFVFLTIFFAFGAAGLALFGREMDEFSTFASSVNTLYRILLGDFMWDKMQSVGVMQAAIFFWLYTIIVVLIMLNMLLAAILETYSTVKHQVGNAETLWSQVVESTVRWYEKRQKRRVGLRFVCECLVNESLMYDAGVLVETGTGSNDSLESLERRSARMSFSTKRNLVVADANSDRCLKLHELMAIVPGIQEAEATEILQKSLSDHLFLLQHSTMDALQEMESMADVVETLTASQMSIRANLLRAINRVDANVRALHTDFLKFKADCNLTARLRTTQALGTPRSKPEGNASARTACGLTESEASEYDNEDEQLHQVATDTDVGEVQAGSVTRQRSDVQVRLDLVERSFGAIMERLNAMDRIPERVQDLTSPIGVGKAKNNLPTGCVRGILRSCQP